MKKNNYIWNFLLIAALTAGALWFALKDNYQEVIVEGGYYTAEQLAE